MARRYESPQRAAAAAQTRDRILTAAAELFATGGFVRTTARDIAERAGTSVQTVHLVGTKSALMVAVLQREFTGDETPQLLTDRPNLRELAVESDLDAALNGAAHFFEQANSRVALLWRAVRAAEPVDEEIAGAVRIVEERRQRDLRIAAQWFVERRVVQPEALDEFADALGFVTASEAYYYFVTERGWTGEQYRRWLVSSIKGLPS